MSDVLYKIAKEGRQEAKGETKDKKGSNSELTGAAIGMTAGGLLGALIKRYIDGDKETKLTDYLLWGGGGAALGGGIGYGLGSMDLSGYTDAEIAKAKEAVKKLEEQREQLAERAKKLDFVTDLGLIPSLWTVGGVGVGAGLNKIFKKRFFENWDKTYDTYRQKFDDARLQYQKALNLKDAGVVSVPTGKKDKKTGKPVTELVDAVIARHKRDMQAADDWLTGTKSKWNFNIGTNRLKRGLVRGLPWFTAAIGVASNLIHSSLNYDQWKKDGSLFINPALWQQWDTDNALENARENLRLMEESRNKK
jgi:hypothetical protein